MPFNDFLRQVQTEKQKQENSQSENAANQWADLEKTLSFHADLVFQSMRKGLAEQMSDNPNLTSYDLPMEKTYSLSNASMIPGVHYDVDGYPFICVYDIIDGKFVRTEYFKLFFDKLKKLALDDGLEIIYRCKELRVDSSNRYHASSTPTGRYVDVDHANFSKRSVTSILGINHINKGYEPVWTLIYNH